ncbi:MAG: flavin reductase family protein [Verrucomicrobia bacterium]|nr:MAG: flavin reductase family protein [Verrucomicrobiota bacterium]
MHLNFTTAAPIDRYKILTAVVVPRPIAWITTTDRKGRINAAPFSFFNAVGTDPALVAISIGDRRPGVPKDTARNIRSTREFVINLVTGKNAAAMNVTAAEFEEGVDELAKAGLTTLPSVQVTPPRIAESPVHLECREVQTIEIGRNRIVIGEVVEVHIDDAYYDGSKGYVATERLDAVGRMHGRGWYSGTSDLFEISRVKPEDVGD